MSFFFGKKNAPPPSPEPAVKFKNAGGVQGTRSLELIRYNQASGKFELGEEALNVLKRTKGPVGVVAVAGRARQGKSYILNQLLGKASGFIVGPSHRPCTKGIWIWGAPVEITSTDGSKYSLILLDTEGIDAYDQTGQYSTQIFSLAVLLSSLFVYNQMGGIDEAALDRLSLVTEMTSHIRVRASDGRASDPSELATFTPSFIWLLRDFYLKLEETDGHAIAPREYLEQALQSLPGASESITAKNRIRESIKSLFPERECFTLVRPVNDEATLARLDELPSSQLRPEFKDGLSRLARLIFAKALPKRLGNQILTGPVLAGLTEAYVTAINSGAVPTIATAWQGVAEAESRRAADVAEAAYIAFFARGTSGDFGGGAHRNSDIPSPSVPSSSHAHADGIDDISLLESAHHSALAAAQREFDTIALGDDSIKKANDQRWRQACDARFKAYKEKKIVASELACEKAIAAGTARIQSLLSGEGGRAATLDDLQRAVDDFQKEYSTNKEISGPVKFRRLAEFMRDVYGKAQKEISWRQAQQAAQRATAAENTVAALRARIAEVEGMLAQSNAQYQALLAREHAAEKEKASMRAELQAAQHSANKNNTDLQNINGQLRAEINALCSNVGNLQAQVQNWESEKARLQATVASVTAARDSSERQLREKEAEVAELKSRIEGLLQRDAAPASTPLRRGAFGGAEHPNTSFGGDDGDNDVVMGVDGSDGVHVHVPPVTTARRTVGEAAVPGPPAPAAPAAAAPAPDTKKMTIAAMKTWLVENGHEKAAWDLAQKKAKKKEYEDCIKDLFN